MLDHVGLHVSDYESSKRFYEAALAPLGLRLQREGISGAGFGRSGKPGFWIKQGEPSPSVHIAFASDDRATVDAFHRAALLPEAMTTTRRDCGPSITRLLVRQPINFAMFDAPRIADCFVAHPRHSCGYGCGSLRALGARMRLSASTQTYGLAY